MTYFARGCTLFRGSFQIAEEESADGADDWEIFSMEIGWTEGCGKDEPLALRPMVFQILLREIDKTIDTEATVV